MAYTSDSITNVVKEIEINEMNKLVVAKVQ